MHKKYLFFNPAGYRPEGDPPEGDPKPTPGQGGKTYTQEELDAMFADRAKRAEEAALKKHYESLGVKDADELKALVEAKKAADDANKSELEKAAANLAKLEKEAADKQAAADTRIAEMTKRLLDSEIKQAAGRPVTDKDGKVTRPAFRTEALDDILVLIAREGIQDKDGKYEGIDKALETLAKAKPYLLADGQPTQKSKGSPPPGGGSGKTPPGNGNEVKPKPYVQSL